MYQHGIASRFRCFIQDKASQALCGFWRQRKSFPGREDSSTVRVCIPVFGFPVTGGTRAVLAGIAQVTNDIWQLEYLTQSVRPHNEHFVIHTFGTKRMAPWQFPAVWFYALAGFWKLFSLQRNGGSYHLILPQDGVYSALFSALVGKLAGSLVVCIDHGTLTLLDSRAFREECIQSIATENWSLLRRLFARLRYVAYWPSLNLLAWLAARFVDHYLVPGIEGDGVEEDCQRLGIPASRLTRFNSMIDISRHVLPSEDARIRILEEKGFPADAILIAMICRLSPEKGIEVALEAISQALASLSNELRERTRVVIAGDGPLRKQVEDDIARRGLGKTCVLWGETSPAEVVTLLGISDIFLYTSTRGACFSMSVLEAMASACALIATTEPVSNQHLLAEGRGIAVPTGDVAQISTALALLMHDQERCHRMGQLARAYIEQYHSPAAFRKTLLRVTAWPALEGLSLQEQIAE